MKHDDILWLAGLMEGEGSFSSYEHKDGGHYAAKLALAMRDKDIVQRAAKLLNARLRKEFDRRYGKYMYVAGLSGMKAVRFSMLLYPYLGDRRRAQISRMYRRMRRNPGHAWGERTRHNRFNNEAVRAMRWAYSNGVTQTRIARVYRTHQSVVSRIVRRLTWARLPDRRENCVHV